MDLHIRTALDGLVPSARFYRLPLDRKGESLYESRPIDPGLFTKAKFFLIISGDLPELKMIEVVPNNFRVASPEMMPIILSTFQKALPLRYVSSPPPGVPKKESGSYFQLDSVGPFWEAIVRSAALAVFLPKEWAYLTVDVIAV